MQPLEVTLALPCYNEEGNIQHVVRESVQHLEEFGRPWEIIVIDNASSDTTREKVRELIADDPRIRLVAHESNRFYSGSCQTAVRECRGEYLAIMDSDRQFTIADLPDFMQKIEAGDDLVFGWRVVRNDPFFRKAVSWLFNTLAWIWLGVSVHDLNVGLRVMNRRCIEAAEFRFRLNFANPELYVRAKQAQLNIGEVSIQHFERTEGAVCHNFTKSLALFVNVNKYLASLRSELRAKSSMVETGSSHATLNASNAA
ncbi:glycosyltransferase family 2 protein [Calycomorphotria hydatis]|uniref:Undecaprenyl-phosphate 4-deoxy-4-formamido-L-arabinose transferase n=1 Tax=Calycomorphotria hydatis TaxID=2528027 RepID=A0A517T7C2_9PLAN|nr:glycosyltransferase family 2 protein [Calycomorphotria hydatis]QDT64274.1 Undecaprenyl-phosphate 4-deoxy-4-formamido-L-arabinose transferase [Calycomorphotria hydatis]